MLLSSRTHETPHDNKHSKAMRKHLRQEQERAQQRRDLVYPLPPEQLAQGRSDETGNGEGDEIRCTACREPDPGRVEPARAPVRHYARRRAVHARQAADVERDRGVEVFLALGPVERVLSSVRAMAGNARLALAQVECRLVQVMKRESRSKWAQWATHFRVIGLPIHEHNLGLEVQVAELLELGAVLLRHCPWVRTLGVSCVSGREVSEMPMMERRRSCDCNSPAVGAGRHGPKGVGRGVSDRHTCLGCGVNAICIRRGLHVVLQDVVAWYFSAEAMEYQESMRDHE